MRNEKQIQTLNSFEKRVWTHLGQAVCKLLPRQRAAEQDYSGSGPFLQTDKEVPEKRGGPRSS